MNIKKNFSSVGLLANIVCGNDHSFG